MQWSAPRHIGRLGPRRTPRLGSVAGGPTRNGGLRSPFVLLFRRRRFDRLLRSKPDIRKKTCADGKLPAYGQVESRGMRRMELRDELQPASPRARILIVEDEVLTRMALAEDLRDAGYSVVEAANADAAMVYLNTGSQIDLVLSDIQMPGSMDGLELARRLRVERPSLPVILSSAAPQEGSILAKPYRMERVLSIISNTLRAD